MSRLSSVLNRLRREAEPLLQEEQERAEQRRREAEFEEQLDAQAEELAGSESRFLKLGSAIVRFVTAPEPEEPSTTVDKAPSKPQEPRGATESADRPTGHQRAPERKRPEPPAEEGRWRWVQLVGRGRTAGGYWHDFDKGMPPVGGFITGGDDGAYS